MQWCIITLIGIFHDETLKKVETDINESRLPFIYELLADR